ncbi:unnamed protein product, partial [Adineta steineri]
QENISQMNLYDFIRTFDHEQNFQRQIEQYEIKDFQLMYFDHIYQLYTNSISNFQHLFTDVSQLLRTPIEIQLDNELSEMLQGATLSVDDIDRIKILIQTITDLLNDLRTNEHFLQRQWTDSLKETCSILAIENSILNLIPDGIKCENYVALCIHLIRMRTILQEQMVNIEEKETKQWDENINNKPIDQHPNRFSNYLNDISIENDVSKNSVETDDKDIWLDIPGYTSTNPIVDDICFDDHVKETPVPQPTTTTFDYESLFQLDVKPVPLTISILFEQIHNHKEESIMIDLKKALKFSITHPDGKVASSFWKGENLFHKLREMFKKEKYDENIFVIIDKNDILLDFLNESTPVPKRMSQEYFIIQKESLFQIEFRFQDNNFKYFVSSNVKIPSIIQRFLTDYNIKPSSDENYLCFFNEHKRTIENETIADLIKQTNNPESKTIPIIITENNLNTSLLYQITLRTKQNQEQIGFFHATANWKHVNEWLTHFDQIIDSPTNEYSFFNKEQKIILDEYQT